MSVAPWIASALPEEGRAAPQPACARVKLSPGATTLGSACTSRRETGGASPGVGTHTLLFPCPLPAVHPQNQALSPTTSLRLSWPCASPGGPPGPLAAPFWGFRVSLGLGSTDTWAAAPCEWAAGGPGAPPATCRSGQSKNCSVAPRLAAMPIRGLLLGRLKPEVKRERVGSHPSCKRYRPIRRGDGL